MNDQNPYLASNNTPTIAETLILRDVTFSSLLHFEHFVEIPPFTRWNWLCWLRWGNCKTMVWCDLTCWTWTEGLSSLRSFFSSDGFAGVSLAFLMVGRIENFTTPSLFRFCKILPATVCTLVSMVVKIFSVFSVSLESPEMTTLISWSFSIHLLHFASFDLRSYNVDSSVVKSLRSI